MADQKWYKKATVQSSLVSAVPSFLVGIATIIIMTWIGNDQNSLTEKIAENQDIRNLIQDERDSILNTKNMELAKQKLVLNLNEIELIKNKSINDSLLMVKQINLWRNQNLTIQKQLQTNELALKNQINFNDYQKINKLNEQLLIEKDNKLKFRIACSNIESSFFILMDSFIYKYGADKTILEINKLHQLFEQQMENPILFLDSNAIKTWRISIITLEKVKYDVLENSEEIDFLIKNPNFKIEENESLVNAYLLLITWRSQIGFSKSFYESVYRQKIKRIDEEIKDGYYTH